MLDISVIIVNYNTAALVKKCVESVLSQRDVSYEIIVVDNASHDQSMAILQSFGRRIQLISNVDNVGFGKANNQAFQYSSGRYLFLLNPDAMCLSDLDLSRALKYMEENPLIGLAGTSIMNSDGQLLSTIYHHYPRQKKTSADFSHLPGNIATVLGASMLVPRRVFEKVRGFDESFFLYAEETDLCLRIRQQGHAIGYCEQVAVQHVGGASEKGNPREEVIRKKKAGKLLFYRKHYSPADVIKLVKSDLKKAKWHLFLLALVKLFFGLNEKQKSKYKQHTVSYELARRFLGRH